MDGGDRAPDAAAGLRALEMTETHTNQPGGDLVHRSNAGVLGGKLGSTYMIRGWLPRTDPS